jgi:FlaG/FlaF family flagellin (archaellin)
VWMTRTVRAAPTAICPREGLIALWHGAGRMTRAARGHVPSGTGAVADVVGSLLMVGMTVGMTVVLAFLLLTYDGPQPEPHVRLSLTVTPGDGVWGNGDEQVRLAHLGGDALSDSAHVLVSTAGCELDLTGPALGGAFADGSLAVGEVWSRACTIQSTDSVVVHVVGETGGPTRLLATLDFVAAGAGP